MGAQYSHGSVPIDNQGNSGACYAYTAARILNSLLRQFGLSNDNSLYYRILKHLISKYGDDGEKGSLVIEYLLSSEFVPKDLRPHLIMRQYSGATDSVKIKSALREGRQLYTGIRLYSSQLPLLRMATVITAEDMRRVRNTSEPVDGHSLTLCDWAVDGTLTLKNSWGPTAGQNGMCRVREYSVLNQVQQPGREVFFLDVEVLDQARLPEKYRMRATLRTSECGPFMIPYDEDVRAFVKEQMVGEGGQGAVFAGKYKGQPAAIKERREKKGVIPLEVSCAFVHPHIVKSLAYTVKPSLDNPEQDIIQIASAYHMLGDLSPDNQFIRLNGTRPCSVSGQLRMLLGYEPAFHILFGVITALRDIHAGYVVHADVCPQNIVIGEDGFSKLCDFGSQVTLNHSLTGGTRGLGHLDYLDQCVIDAYLGDKNNINNLRGLLTEYMDVFSFGKLVYYLILGTPLVPAQHPGDLPAAWTPLLRLADRCLLEDQVSRPTAAVIQSDMRAMWGHKSLMSSGVVSSEGVGSSESSERIKEQLQKCSEQLAEKDVLVAQLRQQLSDEMKVKEMLLKENKQSKLQLQECSDQLSDKNLLVAQLRHQLSEQLQVKAVTQPHVAATT